MFIVIPLINPVTLFYDKQINIFRKFNETWSCNKINRKILRLSASIISKGREVFINPTLI